MISCVLLRTQEEALWGGWWKGQQGASPRSRHHPLTVWALPRPSAPVGEVLEWGACLLVLPALWPLIVQVGARRRGEYGDSE